MRLKREEYDEQVYLRDARVQGYYNQIWQNVDSCVFCDLGQKYIVYEESGIVLTINLFAYIDGHMMVIPRRHVRSVKELTPLEWATMRKMMYLAKKLIKRVHAIGGVQFIIRDGGLQAQSTVGHLHLQCIPFDAPDLSVWNFRKLKYTPLENAQLYQEQSKEIALLSQKYDSRYAMQQAESRDHKEVYRFAYKQALLSKKSSKAKKTAKVGASLIAGDIVITMSNMNLVDGPMEQEHNGTWSSPPTVVHAEEGCIAQAARDGLALQDATMIVTLSPCMVCSRLIVNTGIKELHYIDDWWDQNALDFLEKQGVKVRKLAYKKSKVRK